MNVDWSAVMSSLFHLFNNNYYTHNVRLWTHDDDYDDDDTKLTAS